MNTLKTHITIGKKTKIELKRYLMYALLFIGLYALVYFSAPLLFGNLANACVSSNLFIFITSPVSYCESFSASSFLQGIENNFIWLIIFFVGCVLYSAFIQTYSKKIISLKATVFAAILSTYLFSGFWWYFTSVPATGTSIIAFDLCIFLLVAMSIDIYMLVKSKYEKRIKLIQKSEFLYSYYNSLINRVLNRHKSRKHNTPKFLTALRIRIKKYTTRLPNRYKKRTSAKELQKKLAYEDCILIILILTFFLFLFTLFFLYGLVAKINNSSPLHLMGGFFFLLLIFLYYNLKSHLPRKIFAKTIPSCVFYGMLILLVAISLLIGYFVAQTYSNNVVLGNLQIYDYNSLSNQSILIGNVTPFGYFAPGSNFSYPMSCPHNSTLITNIGISPSNFTVLGIWPALPINFSRGCISKIVIKVKLPDYPYKGNLTLTETTD